MITKEYPASWHKGDEPYYPMNDEKNNALYENTKHWHRRKIRLSLEAD